MLTDNYLHVGWCYVQPTAPDGMVELGHVNLVREAVDAVDQLHYPYTPAGPQKGRGLRLHLHRLVKTSRNHRVRESRWTSRCRSSSVSADPADTTSVTVLLPPQRTRITSPRHCALCSGQGPQTVTSAGNFTDLHWVLDAQ
jgi:hypothetical protein